MKKLIFLLFIVSSSSYGNFEKWKIDYSKRAATRGIPSQFVKEQFAKIKLNEDVIKKEKKQIILDKNKDYNQFMKRWLRKGNERVELGKKMLRKHKDLLNKIEKHYGVDKEIIISLWGVETLYGKITGDYNVIETLASLSYKGRRKKFFELQLNAAMRWIYKGHISLEDFKGSWAGASGQCQFMPSNFKVYGQDFDGDGKVDLWNSKADIFASIANLLKKGGWKKNKSIGTLAKNTKNFKGNLNTYRTPKQYRGLGLRGFDSSRWKKRRASYIPMKNSPVILRGSNYKPLLRWNNSSLFAAFNILLVDSFK